MTWACRYCTFANHDDTSTTCCLCGMPGKRTLLSEHEEPKTANNNNDPEIIDITVCDTDTANDKKLPVKSHSYLPAASVSTVQDDAVNNANAPTTTSRKRKAPVSTCCITTTDNNNNNNNDGKIHDFFTNNTELQRSHKNSTKPVPTSTVKSVQQTTTIQCQYPHSFSYNLVPKRTSQEAKQDIRKTLDSIFKLRKLRNLQPHAINCALQLESQMIVMATGGGKSLCYQLPACLLGGVTIVISPLLALMKDQTEALNAKGIPAACVSSTNTETQNAAILERVVPSLSANVEKTSNRKKKVSTAQQPQLPTPVLLYITPESIESNRMRTVLERLYSENRLALFAVDEAHCLSSWGHDFRPAYRRLNYLRTKFPKTPCMALTATATPNVILDITKELSLEGCPIHVGSFDRPNINYTVKFKDAMDNPIQDLVKIISKTHQKCESDKAPCSGIVYVHKREDTAMIASAISKAGISACAYHAGLKKNDRLAVQEGWSNGNIQVAVATVAFGMGIDKDCVRYVIHWCLPKSIEGFYQESGRAGRDGQPSHSILYYSSDDVRKFKFLIQKQSSSTNRDGQKKDQTNLKRKLSQLADMERYCTELKCRRNTLIRHFGGDAVDCKRTCDFCCNPKEIERALRSAKAVKDARNQISGRGKQKQWDGQWDGPHEESFYDDDWGEHGMMVGDLRVTGPLEVDPGSPEIKPSEHRSSVRFVKASDILSKYEAMEGKAKRNGTFFAGSESDLNAKRASVNIPPHLIASLKAASTKAMKPKTPCKEAAKVLSSEDHAKNAAAIEEQLARMKSEREARLKALLAKTSKKATAPPPPPPLSFGRKK
ncbi:ATP-dependent DNA helicase RecQ [Nitzschia inconspicua]|uniref:ATP-dependent DNA helicase n=1 Tax=Nitzschia inconspicua TaxID=303405 RepID=A0A9K3LKQ3_9STRA|nr:ATP-dependent DNA helicase RecQ [Nitzschia inconspicua]